VVADLLRPVDEKAEGLVLGGQVIRSDRTRAGVPLHSTTSLPRLGGRALTTSPDLVGAHHAAICDTHHILVAYERIRMLDHQAHGRRGCQGAAFGRSQVAPVQFPIHPELKEGTCALDRRPQCIRIAPGQVTGVAALGQGRHREPHAELLLPRIDPLCGGLSGPVRIERQDDPLCEARHDPGVLGGQRSTAGGHRPLDPS